MTEIAAPIHTQLQGIGGAFTLSLIAFSMVFLVLCGLTAVIYGIQYLAGGIEGKKSGGDGTVKAPAPAPAAPAAPALSISPAGDGKLMAVLAAAVAAVEGGGGRITSVRPGAFHSPAGTLEWRRTAIFEGLGGLSRDWK